jgi:hypothetical protein
VTDRRARFHSNSSVGRASCHTVRRSWHLFEVVSFDGCPGFKGPDPQPVSMSGTKCREGSEERQGIGSHDGRSPYHAQRTADRPVRLVGRRA